LFGVQTIFDRVVDVLEEMTIDPLVNGSDNPLRIDKQDATLVSAVAASDL
jgi:hypothetical protein